MKKLSLNSSLMLCLLAALFVFSSCEDDEPNIAQPVAEFAVEVTDLTVAITNNSLNATTFAWEFGDGNISTEREPAHTYEEAGDYTITLVAAGELNSTPSTQTVDVTVTEPPLLNLIAGGGFEASDASVWTVLHSGQKDADDNLQHVKYEFGYEDYKPTDGEGGSLYIYPDNDAVSPSEEGTIFYQKIDNLEAGDYVVQALIRLAGENQADPTAAMNQYWFEIVLHEDEPVEGDGYNNGRLTGWYYGGWTGWELEVPTLNGEMPHGYIADSKANAEGEFTLDKSGTYYLVIKAGKGWDDQGASFGDGIALDDLVIAKVD